MTDQPGDPHAAAPPPPPPGYGYPPPNGAVPYPPGPYPGPYGPPRVDVLEAFRYGWAGFARFAGPFLGAMVAYVAVVTALVVVGYGAMFALIALTAQGGEGAQAVGGFGSLALFGVVLLVAAAAGFVMQAALARAAMHLTQGQPIAVGTFFRFERFGQVVLASALVGLAVTLGSMVLYLPGIVAAFYGQFVLFFVIGRGLTATEAIRASIAFTNANLGPTLLVYLGYGLVTMLGSFLCGVGVLVAVPVGVLAQAFVFRRLHGEPVADPARL